MRSDLYINANNAFDAGDYDQAIRIFEKMIGTTGNEEVHYLCGKAKLAKARQISSLVPKSMYLAGPEELYFQLNSPSLAQVIELYKSAISHFRAVGSSTDSAKMFQDSIKYSNIYEMLQMQFELGRIYDATGNSDLAKIEYDQVHTTLTTSYVSEDGKYLGDARESHSKSIGYSSADKVNMLLASIIRKLQIGQKKGNEDAELWVAAALSVFPFAKQISCFNAETIFYEGVVEFYRGNFQKSIDLMDDALKQDPAKLLLVSCHYIKQILDKITSQDDESNFRILRISKIIKSYILEREMTPALSPILLDISVILLRLLKNCNERTFNQYFTEMFNEIETTKTQTLAYAVAHNSVEDQTPSALYTSILYLKLGEASFYQGYINQSITAEAQKEFFFEAKKYLLKAIALAPNRKFAEAYKLLSQVFKSMGDENSSTLAYQEAEELETNYNPDKSSGEFLRGTFAPEDQRRIYIENLHALDFSYQHIDSLQVENIAALVDILMQLKYSYSFNIKMLEDCSFGKISVIGFYLNAIKFYEIDIEKVILPLSSEVVSIFLCNLGGSLENKSASAMIQKVMQEATSPEALAKSVVDICTLLTKVPSIVITKFTPEDRQKLLDSIANLEKTYLTEAQIKTLDSTTRVRELEEVAKVFSIYKIPFERVLACQGDQLKRLHASVEVLGNNYGLFGKDFAKLTNDQINALAGEDGENAFLFMTYGLAPRKFVPNDKNAEALDSQDIRLLVRNIRKLKELISKGQYQDLGFAHVKNLPSSTTVIADNIDLFRENDIDTKTLITYSAAEIASIVRSIKAIIGLKDLPSRCSMEQLIAIDGKLVPLDRKLGLTYEDIVEFTADQIKVLVALPTTGAQHISEQTNSEIVFKTLGFRAVKFKDVGREEFTAVVKDIAVVNKAAYKPQDETVNPILELPLAVISSLAKNAKHLLKEYKFPLKEFQELTTDVIECLAKNAQVLFEPKNHFTPQNYAGLNLEQIQVLVPNYDNFFKKQKLTPVAFKAIDAEKMKAIAKYATELLNAEQLPEAFSELSAEQIEVIGQNAKIILEDCGFTASKFAIFTPNQIKWLVNDLMILGEYTERKNELSLLSFEQIRALSMNAEVLFGMEEERAEFKPNTFRETPAHRITEIAREKYISSQKAVADSPKSWQLGEEVYSTESANLDAPFIYSLDPEQKLYGMIHPSLLEQLNKDGGGIRGQVENALAKGLKFNGKYVIGVIKQGGIYKVKTDTDLRVYTTKQYENEEGKMLLIFDRSGGHRKISAESRQYKHQEVTTIKAEVTFKYEAPSAEEADSGLSGVSDDDADF